MNPEAPQPPNLGRGGLRGFCEKQWASHTTGALCRVRAEPPADPGFTAHPVSSGTNQNTPATGHHRVCLFLELRKCRAPRQLSSGGSNPGGSIGGGRQAVQPLPVPVMGPGQAQGRAASRRQPDQEGWLPGCIPLSPPERLRALLPPVRGRPGPLPLAPAPFRALITACDTLQ